MTQVFNYDELANSPSLFSIGGNVVEYVLYHSSHALTKCSAIKIKAVLQTFLYQ